MCGNYTFVLFDGKTDKMFKLFKIKVTHLMAKYATGRAQQ